MLLRSRAFCITALFALLASTAMLWAAPPTSGRKAQVTILYDAIGRPSAMQKDWGFAALIEYEGKRILFDTGDNPDILGNNARVKGVDLSQLDFVVLSHRHGDHMGGMEYLLDVNPNVLIYAPNENFGVYGFSLPSTFYRKDESLRPELRYYGGAPPKVMKFGSAWPRANFQLIDQTVEIAPGMHLISLVSDKPTTLELHELSLAIETPEGIVLVVGCSHPGIDRIVEAASKINPHIHMIVGGLHLVVAKDPEIARIVTVLRDEYQVDFVGPGHCTGEPMFAALLDAFGDHYLYAGLGQTIAFDQRPVNASLEAAPSVAMDEAEAGTYRALLAGSDDRAHLELAQTQR